MPDQSEQTEERKAILGLIVYGIILNAVIVVYRYFMITAAAVFVFLVSLVIHSAPRIRDRREKDRK